MMMREEMGIPADRPNKQKRVFKAPEIRIEHLTFRYTERLLFEDFTFTIAAGQWTCLLGPSGCGKSTLLRMISGSLTRGVSGNIQFTGQSRMQGQIAWMAQKDLLLPWLSVLDNVLLGDRLRGTRQGDLRRRALELLESVGLEGYSQALPASLSGGMRQRTALLRTLMEERPVILMDEPFSALDALTRLKLQNLAARLVKGATVLLVTHDPWEALRLGHRIFIMKGRPARLSNVFLPPGTPPRNPDQKVIASMYAQLLDQLVEKANE
jgi:putative hydroxymethylpyrimidine transport system ATP-binding protein